MIGGRQRECTAIGRCRTFKGMRCLALNVPDHTAVGLYLFHTGWSHPSSAICITLTSRRARSRCRLVMKRHPIAVNSVSLACSMFRAAPGFSPGHHAWPRKSVRATDPGELAEA